MYKYSKMVIYAAKATVLVSAVTMLISGCGHIGDAMADNASNTAEPEADATEESLKSEDQNAAQDESAKAEKQAGPDIIEQDKIDYPFVERRMIGYMEYWCKKEIFH